jgi:hypothetical protein
MALFILIKLVSRHLLRYVALSPVLYPSTHSVMWLHFPSSIPCQPYAILFNSLLPILL